MRCRWPALAGAPDLWCWEAATCYLASMLHLAHPPHACRPTHTTHPSYEHARPGLPAAGADDTRHARAAAGAAAAGAHACGGQSAAARGHLRAGVRPLLFCCTWQLPAGRAASPRWPGSPLPAPSQSARSAVATHNLDGGSEPAPLPGACTPAATAPPGPQPLPWPCCPASTAPPVPSL